MKIIILGDAEGFDTHLIERACEAFGISISEIEEVVTGSLQVMNTMGEQFAARHGIPIMTLPFGRGRMLEETKGRYRGMCDYADAVLAIWSGTDELVNYVLQYASTVGCRVLSFYAPPSQYVEGEPCPRTAEEDEPVEEEEDP